MARRRWKPAAVIGAFAVLILVPPGIKIGNTGDYAWCHPIGEWRDPVNLFDGLTSSQTDAVDRYVEQDSFGQHEDEDRAVAQEIIVAACDDAREDRQTLIIVAAVVVAAVVVRRSRPESAGQPNGTRVTPAAPEEGR